MTTDPYPAVEVDVSFTPSNAAPVWTDISSDVDLSTELSFGGGRQYELDVIEPGSASIPVDNSKGRYTGGSSTSPYAPYVLPQRRVRVRGKLPAGTFTDLWHGRIRSWPTLWPGGSGLYSMASLPASDLTARLKSDKLRSSYAEEILADNPVAWWPLDDPAGSSGAHDGTGTYPSAPLQIAIDQSGSTTATAVFGSSGVAGYDAGSALAFGAPTSLPPSSYPWWLPTYVNKAGPLLTPATTGITIEAVVLVPVEGGAAIYYPVAGSLYQYGWSTIYGQGRNNPTDHALYGSAGYVPLPDIELGIFWAPLNLASGGPPTAFAACNVGTNGIGQDIIGFANPINDGKPHHLMLTVDTGAGIHLYVDGILQSSSPPTGFPAAGPDWAGIGARGNRMSASAGIRGETWMLGTIQHVAIYNTVLSATRRTARVTALAGNLGETADARITRLAGYIGWSLSDLALDTGIDGLGGYTIDGVDPWAAMQTTAADDGGEAFLSRAGAITFHNRRRPHTNVTPAVTLDCANQDIAADLSFLLDDTHVATIVEVSSATAKVHVEATGTVRADYGDLTLSKALNILDTSALADAANAILADVSTPKTRGGTVTIDLLGQSNTIKTWALQADLGDRIRLINLPSQAPAATLDFVLEQRSHAIQRAAAGGHWQLKCEVSPAPVLYVTEGTLCDSGPVVAW